MTTTQPSPATLETGEQWSRDLPDKSGWYYMRDEGQEPIAEGLIVWVGHNRSGVRHEGQFFYADHKFLERREFLGPITREAVNSHATLLREREALREALKPFANAASGYEDVDGHHTYLDADPVLDAPLCRLTVGDLRKARAALGDKQ